MAEKALALHFPLGDFFIAARVEVAEAPLRRPVRLAKHEPWIGCGIRIVCPGMRLFVNRHVRPEDAVIIGGHG
jgi:hypothetical protein